MLCFFQCIFSLARFEHVQLYCCFGVQNVVEQAVQTRQLLDGWERHERGVHCVSCGDVQRKQRVNCNERMPGLPSGGVLPCWLQLVARERAVWAWKLLDSRERHERILHCVSCGNLQCGERVHD